MAGVALTPLILATPFTIVVESIVIGVLVESIYFKRLWIYSGKSLMLILSS